MGGGVSSVSQDVNAKLTPESLAKLQAYQAKCIEEDMHPFDMFNNLTHMYEELLTADFERRNRLEVETDSIDIIKKIEYAKDAAAIDSGENIAVPEHLADFYKEKERIDKELLDSELLANLKDLKKLDLDFTRDPYVEDVVGKLFSIHNVYSNLTFDEYLKLTVPPEPEHLDPEVMDCKICCIAFENHNQYKQHILHSDLHPKNVMEKRKRMFERFKEGERLSGLAKSTVTIFFKAPPADELHSHSQKLFRPVHDESAFKTSTSGTPTEEVAGQVDHSKHAKTLWKKATARVIATRLRHQYEAIVDALNMLPSDVKLYHSDHKYFYNVKCNFVFNFYLHHKHQCIEVVPFAFLPPNAHLHPEGHSTGGTPTHAKTKAPVEPQEGEHLVKACHRLYFNYYSLLGLVMGNTRLTGVITDHEEDLSSHILHKDTSPTNGHNHMHTANLSVVAVENLQDNEMISLVNDSVCIFVLSHMKTHNLTKKAKHLPMLQQKIEETLFFDGEQLEVTPLFEKMPEGLRPVELHESKIYNQWKDKFAHEMGFFPQGHSQSHSPNPTSVPS